MDELNKRVLLVLGYEARGKGELAQLLDISPAQLSHIYSGRNKPGVDILQKLILHFPRVNAAWLLTGQGQMFDERSLKTKEFKLLLNTVFADLQAIRKKTSAIERQISDALGDDLAG